MSDFLEYENGVADVLGFIVQGNATVERNVHLPGKSGTTRQIDVLVGGQVFGLHDAVLAVDCKRWKSRLDVADAEAFLGLLDDISADLGLLVTTKGASPAAQQRLRQSRGARVEVLSLEELDAWCPRGTVHVSYALPEGQLENAAKVLRRAGFRARLDKSLQGAAGEVVLQALRYYETGDGAEQRRLHEVAAAALAGAGVPARQAANGVTAGGGTPAHRWLDVVYSSGKFLGLKILVDSEAAASQRLDRIAEQYGLVRTHLDIARPAGWPVVGLFGLPG